MTTALSEIWNDDLFGRHREATDLIGYLESVVDHEAYRSGRGGHVLSIDASYGYGKTFFLNRLAKQLATNHPVAFVDAWADDLQDEPLIAISATLHEALEPYASKELSEKLTTFGRKIGEISKVVGGGIARRALGLLITQTAADAVSDIVSLDGDSAAADLNREGFKQTASDIVQTAKGGATVGSIEKRIAEFRAGKVLLDEVRASLRAVVSEIQNTSAHLPIVIIIDELDRCRPNYAIKLLEEVKHLFDVEGVVFILGMHQGQLTHSVASAYGGEFDGTAYLSRFIDRRYTLETPSLVKLVGARITALEMDVNRLIAPNIADGRNTGQKGKAELIAMYLEAMQIGARDTIKIMDALYICLGISKSSEIYLPHILPIVIDKICGLSNFVAENFSWSYWVTSKSPKRFGIDKDYVDYNPVQLFNHIEIALKKPLNELRSINYDEALYAEWVAIVGDNWQITPSYESLRGYRRLINAVSRFSTPQ